ncbi:WAS/WASL-interacting protein family member 3 [Phoca vitulina]|uniref:WAS/WASL-interacting protein family member 3 n=1 Tax=Phoca vitulina TaxID=9720 RepID=UPI0013962A99|nr:WAS/WASL-interacting protein family member 3 [Phoca vitulina]
MPPRALRRAAAAAPLRLRAPPPRSAGLKPRPARRSGAPPHPPPIGCPRSRLPPPGHGPRPPRPPAARPGRPELAIGPRSRGPARRPRFGARQVPHSTRTEFPPVSCPGGQEAAAGIAGSGRRSGSEKQLSPALFPPQCRCRRAGIPSGLGGCEREAARVPARFRRGCSPRPPRLPRLPAGTELSSARLPGPSRFPSSPSRPSVATPPTYARPALASRLMRVLLLPGSADQEMSPSGEMNYLSFLSHLCQKLPVPLGETPQARLRGILMISAWAGTEPKRHLQHLGLDRNQCRKPEFPSQVLWAL